MILKRRAGQEGQTLVIAILIITMALILVPYLVMKVQNEGRWSVKEARTTASYHLAEAGQDRAVWQLVSSTQSWQNAVLGSPTSGYAGDVQYTDVSGGLYDINITSGPLINQVTVVTKGRDDSSKEVRSVKAVYAGAALQSGLITQGTFGINPNFFVYWGQITAYDAITQTTGSGGGHGSSPTTAFTGCDSHGNPTGGVDVIPYYPYKDSVSSISPWDTTPNPPNSDATKNYTAYDTKLPAMPVVDFNYYRGLAKNSLVPIPKDGSGTLADGGRSAAWVGTGYFDGSGHSLNWDGYKINCSTCVIFDENDEIYLTGNDSPPTNAGYVIVNAMILFGGNFHIHSDGIYAYNLTPPSNAWQQYTAGTYVNPTGPGDTSASNEYPGDCGLHTACATYTVPNSSHSAAAVYTSPTFDQCGNTGLSFRGFLYINSFNCALGHNVLSGQVYIGPGGTDIGTGNGVTHVIYYDSSIAASVRYSRPPLTRISWTEQVAGWP